MQLPLCVVQTFASVTHCRPQVKALTINNMFGAALELCVAAVENDLVFLLCCAAAITLIRT